MIRAQDKKKSNKTYLLWLVFAHWIWWVGQSGLHALQKVKLRKSRPSSQPTPLKWITYSQKIILFQTGHTFHIWRMPNSTVTIPVLYDAFKGQRSQKRHAFRMIRAQDKKKSNKTYLLWLVFAHWIWWVGQSGLHALQKVKLRKSRPSSQPTPLKWITYSQKIILFQTGHTFHIWRMPNSTVTIPHCKNSSRKKF